jgi:hypothetical protein
MQNETYTTRGILLGTAIFLAIVVAICTLAFMAYKIGFKQNGEVNAIQFMEPGRTLLVEQNGRLRTLRLDADGITVRVGAVNDDRICDLSIMAQLP